LSLWVAGAGVAVVLSFVVIGLFVRNPTSAGSYPRTNLLRWRVARVLVDPRLWLVAQIISIGLLALVIATGVLGKQDPTRNLAPTAVWVIWWVGFAYLSSLLGNVWMIVNPWSAVFEMVGRATGGRIEWDLAYPRSLGVWPAVVLFGAFAWTELVFDGRAVPAQLALLIIGYSLITWAGMALFGRSLWLARADPFALVFGLLARFAPLELRVSSRRWCRRCRTPCDGAGSRCVNCIECFAQAPEAERELNLRPPASGLLEAEHVPPSMVVFVLLVLATVTFDGFMATPTWSTIESALYAVVPGDPDSKITVTETIGLLGLGVLFVLIYRLFAEGIAIAARHKSPSRMAGVFVLSLVPISLAYHLAHYFTYLLIQGQLAVPLASDPFGYGWNLLGTATYRPDVGLVDARVAWYAGVVAIVAGHIVAVYIAHVVALQEFQMRRAVVRSQLVMLILMVGYTTASLWIIAQPIVEFGGAG
jgi:polyferredoxin